MTDAVVSKFPTTKVRVKAAISRTTTMTKLKVNQAYQHVKGMDLSDWGSVAAISGICIYVFDRARGKKISRP